MGDLWAVSLLQVRPEVMQGRPEAVGRERQADAGNVCGSSEGAQPQNRMGLLPFADGETEAQGGLSNVNVTQLVSEGEDPCPAIWVRAPSCSFGAGLPI